MIVEIFFSLVMAGLLSLLLIDSKRLRLVAALAFFATLCISIFAVQNMLWGESSAFIYQWIPYEDLRANLNLSSAKMVYIFFMPILGITIFLMFINLVAVQKKIATSLNVMWFFNLAAFIVLLCSDDFIQLMVGGSAISVIAFYQINDTEAKKKFVFYNLLADMMIFTTLAIVYSQVGSVELQYLAKFERIGSHKDLIAILLVLSLGAKAGLFFFQNQLLDLQQLDFKRIWYITLISTPLASLILYYKLSPLLVISDFSGPLLKGILGLSVLWGMIGCWLVDNLKAKILYLNMVFYAFAFALLVENLDNLILIIPYALIGQLLLSLSLFIVVKAASNEVYVSEMGGFVKYIKFSLLLSFLMIIAVLSFYMKQSSNVLIYLYLAGVLLPLASTWQQIYWAKSTADEIVLARLQNVGFLYWLPMMLASVGAIYYFAGYKNWLVVEIMLIFVAFMLLNPLRFVKRWSENEFIQEADVLEKIYNLLFLLPIRLMGRILWLTVDFIFIERTIIGSIGQGSGLVVRGLQRMQTATWLNYLVMVIMGLMIMVIMVGYKYYE